MTGLLNIILSLGSQISGSGYFSGGSINASSTTTNSYIKISYSSESVSTLSTTLSLSRELLGGVSNSGTAGYSVGGSSGANTIDKLIYSTETSSAITNLINGRSDLSIASDNGTAAYMLGGSGSSAIQKLVYSTDANNIISATLSTGNYNQGVAQNKSVAVYSICGYSGGILTGIDKISLPGETRSTLSATVSPGVWLPASASNDGVAGYVVGGTSNLSTMLTSAIKLNFSTDTVSTLSNILSTGLGRHAGAANKAVCAYFSGGSGVYGSNASDSSLITKLNFSSDIGSVVSQSLPQVRRNHAGMGNSGSY
jgi:hypothetical protein